MFKSNYNVANFGVNGTGPLVSLAITKEYASRLKPKNVFYLFYEGNDLRDMMFEEKTFLKKYPYGVGDSKLISVFSLLSVTSSSTFRCKVSVTVIVFNFCFTIFVREKLQSHVILATV